VLADNLDEVLNRKRTRPSTWIFFYGCCMSRRSQKCNQDKSRDRVSSTFRNADERKMSLPSSRTIVADHDYLKVPHIFCHRGEKSIKIVNSLKDSSIRKDKSRLHAPNKWLVEKGGGPKRPGLLRAGPIEVRRGPASVITQKNEARFKANLKATIYVSSATDSQSSEYYDDRSPVFGGWTSDSSDRNSCSRFRLSKLGSSESDRDYGGEEGAKQFDFVNNRDLSSHAPSLSEGPAEEENKRPNWSSDNDELPEVIIFHRQSSPSEGLHFLDHSHSEEKEISDCNLAQYKERFDVLGDIQLSPELLRGGMEGRIMSKNIVILD